MSMVVLGKLTAVDPRTAWAGEASDFTPWLAQEENLALLGETIGLDLALEAIEKNVGPFRADILARNTVSGELVLIENQLEKTDHTHLGQILTYAAGLKAVTIVWIARFITPEHRAALDWLNEITTETVNFFGLEIELWRISESPLAPKFNVVSQPNDWAEVVRANAASSTSLTEANQFYLEYWSAFVAYRQAQDPKAKARKPTTDNWMDFAVGRSGFVLQAVVSLQKRYIMMQLLIGAPGAKAYFDILRADNAAIEKEIGQPVKWIEPPGKKSRYIALYQHDRDLADRADWDSQHAWLLAQLQAFRRSLAPRVKALPSMLAEPGPA